MGNTTSSADSDDEILLSHQKDMFGQTSSGSSSSSSSDLPSHFVSRLPKEEDVTGDAAVENEQESPSLLDLSLLFDITSLRQLATKIPEEMPENILQQHQEHLIRWLEEKLQRNEETVSLSQFYDVLLNRSVDRNECRKVFQQFDCEGESIADVKLMLDFLKKYNGSNLFVDLNSIIRTFQSCSYTPGFIDIYNEDKDCIDRHASCLLKFIVKNRASVSIVPYSILNNFNNVVSMRLSVLRYHFAKFKKSSVAAQKVDELAWNSNRNELYTTCKCVASYEVSSNKADAHRLFLNESSYWQSDGSARSHWIRLRMRSNVVIKQLSIGVSSSDQSYMPQYVVVLVGRQPADLHEIKETRIQAHVNGDIVLLENAKVHYPLIQINVKRCHSEGCDTRIHNLKVLGYRPVKEQGVTTMDAASGWFLQVVSDTAMACLPMAPSLRTNILDHTRSALGLMPPLSLSPSSSDRPACISSHVLKEVDAFLQKMAVGGQGKVSKDGLDVLLSFSITQGHLVSALKTLMMIKDAQIEEMEMGKLLCSMKTVIGTFWKKHSQSLQMTILGSDGGRKDDTSAASNVLNSPWVMSQPYLSGDGQTKVNMFFRGSDIVQLTKLKIKVDRGEKGPKSGMVFVYNHSGEFNMEQHVKRFEFADSWRHAEYSLLNANREAGNPTALDVPVAYFTATDDWDEIEVNLDAFPVGQYVLVKFLEPRSASAERLGIVGIKFFGFDRKYSQMGSLYDILCLPVADHSMASCQRIIQQALAFFVSLARDQTKPVMHAASQTLNMSDLSMKVLWDFYSTIKNSPVESGLVLQLLHALFPSLTHLADKDQEATEAFFKHLCHLVDSERPTDDTAVSRNLLLLVKEVITDGAAVFFPDKEARSKQLFSLIKDISDTNEAPSVTLTFQSLCQFFSNVDPSALLDLPSSPTQSFEASQVLRVMGTLVSVAYRECLTLMQTATQSEKSSHLVHLLGSLQTNLFTWCCCQMESDDRSQVETAETIIKNYVALLSPKVISALEAYADYSVEQMTILMDKLKVSFLYSTFCQLVLLSHLCSYMDCLKRSDLLSNLMKVMKQLHKISVKLPKFFHQVDSGYWRQMEEDKEILKVWDVESSHTYENNLNVVQVFSCPGASTFVVEFDPRCETEKRYDYLEFTDARGNKTRYDQRVDTDKWPLKVTFEGGSRLQFVFRSDSSNNEWGYKFKVTAKGSSDVPVCWMFDIYLNLAKLIGQFCGSCLDITKVLPKCDLPDGKEEFDLELLRSDLWTTLFRSGFQSVNLHRTPSGVLVCDVTTRGCVFISNLLDSSNEEAKLFLSKCKEHHFGSNQNMCIGSPSVYETVVHVFSALLWHTQALQDDIDRYAKGEENGKLSEGILQAYSTAESLRRSYVSAERAREKITSPASSESYDALAAVKEKAAFLLRFAGMTKIPQRMEQKSKCERKAMKIFNRVPSLNSDKGHKAVESTFDKYPSFRLVLDFIQDPAWSAERVEQLLSKREQHAKSATVVFSHLVEFLEIVSGSTSNIFQVPVVLLFQEVLHFQDKFSKHYAEGLDGCGLELEERVRSSFYAFVRYIVKAIDEGCRTGLQRCVQCYDYIEACTLHFLDISWQLHDMPLLEELKLPDLYYRLAIGSLSVHEETLVPVDEVPELEEYKTTMSWLEECRKTGYNAWHEKHKKEHKKLAQMFSARYSEVLEVDVCCDGCGTTLPGGRYRCLECTDVNLCFSCYADGIVPMDGHSVEHDLIHFLFRCDGCQGFIIGTRIHCNVCDDFDLCLGCQNSNHYPTKQHKPEHSFVLFPAKKLSLVRETYSLLKSYIHNHVWLLYSSLALSIASILYSRHQDPVDCDHIQPAIQLYNRVISLLIGCCMLTPVSTLPLADGNEEDIHLRTMQEEFFVLYSHERIMGLLGAMIPEPNKTRLAEDVSQAFVSEEFMNMLFSIARGEVGRDCNQHHCAFDCNMQHFALGLIGQLLQRIPTSCKLVDLVLGLNSDSSESETSQTEDAKPQGYKTVQYLFQLGASCLERSGLEWANTMATILQKLFTSSEWQTLILSYLNEGIAKLKKGPSLPSIFALYVVAGFPEILSLGSLVKYTDVGTDARHGIVMKHFADKNRTLIVDRLTRRRQTLKDICIEVISFNNCFVSEVHVLAFADVIRDSVGRMKQSEPFSVEDSWVLYLVLKALLKAACLQTTDITLSRLFEPEFIRCVVHLAGLGTGFSKQWLVTDLEILSLMLYTKDDLKRLNSAPIEEEDDVSVQRCELMATCSSDDSTCDPLEDLDHLARQTFNTLNTNLHVPMAVLRAVYEMHSCSTDSLILAVHENLRNDSFHPSEEVLKLSRKWEESRSGASVELDGDKAVDIGLQSVSMAYVKEKKDFDGKAAEEPMNESQRLITAIDSNLKDTISRQRHRNSAVLLRKELEKDRTDSPAEFHVKVNNALSVLYARQVLSVLLADKSSSRHVIMADLIGCQVEADLPYVLDLLNRPESKETFQKMVENVIQHCKPEGLVSVAMISCDFMEEVSLMTVIKQNSSTDSEYDEVTQDKVHIPGALYLSVQFDSRCYTEDNDVKLVISSTSDYKQDRRVFSGPNYQWSNFEIPGDTIYFKFTSDPNAEFFYKFTVLGSRFGRFDTGYRILNGLLRTPTIVRLLPLSDIWSCLIRVACKQIGQRRLKSVQLLLLLLHSQFRDAGCTALSLELQLLRPLWRLQRKMADSFQDTICILPPLVRALTELFFYAENLAMEWGITEDYVASLIDDEDVQNILLQGLETIAALSHSISYENVATEAFRSVKHLSTNWDKSKGARSPKSIIV